MGQPAFMEKGRWPQRALFKLIEEWRKNEILYNTTIPDNKKNAARDKAVSSILLTINKEFPHFDCSIQLIKHKLKMLRTQYAREIRRMKLDKSYKPKFSIFCELDFLREFTGVTERVPYTSSQHSHSARLTSGASKRSGHEPRKSKFDYVNVDPLDTDEESSELSDMEMAPSGADSYGSVGREYSADETTNKLQNATDCALNSASGALHLMTQNALQNSIESAFEQYVKNEMITMKNKSLKTEMREKIMNIIIDCKRKDNR